MIPSTLFGPVDVLAREAVGDVLIVEFLLLGLAVVNMAARLTAHHSYVSAAREGEDDEAISRSLFLEVTTVLLVFGAFYYTTVALHAGIVFSMLVLGLFLSDFFEFEARLVEARTETDLERPKSAIVASMFVLAYIAYKSLFFLIRPLWESIV